MLIKIIHRAKEIINNGGELKAATEALNFFLHQSEHPGFENHLETFCRLDDTDVMATIKNWCNHPDKILSTLCRFLVERKLLKVKLQAEPFDNSFIEARKKDVMENLQLSNEEADYFVFTGEAVNTTYNPKDERINILFKDGTVKDISQVDNALIHHHLSATVKKHYICYLRV